jgi:tetratricopeptide (TPR) repeat protein
MIVAAGTVALGPAAQFVQQEAYASHNRRARDAYRAGRYSECVREASEMIRMSPDGVAGYHWRAVAYNRLARYEEAVADCSSGIMQRPSDRELAALLQHRSRAYRHLRRLEEALGDAKEAVRLDPANDVAREERLAALGAAHRWRDLKRFSSEEIAAGRILPYAYLSQGAAEGELHEYAAAVRDYGHASRLRPNDPHIYWNLGWYQFKKADYGAALVTNEAALQRDPKLYVVMFNQGLCYAVMGDAPHAKTYYQRGREGATSDQRKKALDEVREAIQEHPASAGALHQAEAWLSGPETTKQDGPRSSSSARAQ